MPEPREPRRYDPARATLRKRTVRYVDLDLKSRNEQHVRKAVRDTARQYYEEYPEHCRDPALLTHSFMGRFDASKGVTTLLETVSDLDVLSHAIGALYTYYEDETLPALSASVALGASNKDMSPRELRHRLKVLREAADVIWHADEREIAMQVLRVALRYRRALGATGKAPRRRAGAPPSPAGDLALWLDLELDELDQAERHSLIAQLVTDFIANKTPDQIRYILRERYRQV